MRRSGSGARRWSLPPKGNPATKARYYSSSPMTTESDDNKLVVVAYWDTKSHDDALATTGPWRAGSELRNKIDVLLSEEPSTVEMEVAYLNAPRSP